MATSKESKGFLQTEWVCPNCNTRNPGPQKVCDGCGAPQPANVQFYLPAEAKLIQDKNVEKAAKAGADIHCGFCGTRNPATAATCSQCGGELKEGKAREAGREMQKEAPIIKVKCANCGQENPSTSRMCANCGAPLAANEKTAAQANLGAGAAAQTSAAKRKFPWLIVGGIFACLLFICVGAFMLFRPSKAVTATVDQAYWQTVVPLQEIRAVTYSNEQGAPPSNAYNVSCRDETEQVCEEKTVDQGNGYAEVVQECHDDTTTYCSYTVDEWATIESFTLDGYDFSPQYSQPDIFGDQRLGDISTTLEIRFIGSDGRQYTYRPASLDEFQMFAGGSSWTLRLNALGGVVSVEP